MTMPSEVLKQLGISTGSMLEMNDEGFAAQPTKRRCYTSKELLHGATPKKIKALKKATEWALGGKSVGRELDDDA